MSKTKEVTTAPKSSTEKVREANKKKNAKKPVTRKLEGISYLKEGVTGAMLNQAKLATNSNAKEQRAKISRVIAEAKEADKGYFSSLNLSSRQMNSKLRPLKVLSQATDYELTLYFNSICNEKVGYPKHHVWGVLTMTKRVLDEKKENPLAKQFFTAWDIIEKHNEGKAVQSNEVLNECFESIADAAEKALANVEAKRAEKEAKEGK